MARSAKRPEPVRSRNAPAKRVVRREPSFVGVAAELAMRNPRALGGGTAFLVALSFVSANAIWYQPHRHLGAFFATRPVADAGLPATGVEVAGPAADPTIRRAQSALKTLGVYAGPLDGIDGPATRRAIAVFQTDNGLVVSGELDEAAIAALVDQTTTTQTIPARTIPAQAIPASRPIASVSVAEIQPAVAVAGAERVKRVQAGLKAFGNEAIVVDGIMGARTQGAIREIHWHRVVRSSTSNPSICCTLTVTG